MRPLFDNFSREQLIDLILEQDKLITGMKICGDCRQYKLIREFHARKLSSDGLQARCKECMRARGAKWRENNAEYIKQARDATLQLKREGKK